MVHDLYTPFNGLKRFRVKGIHILPRYFEISIILLICSLTYVSRLELSTIESNLMIYLLFTIKEEERVYRYFTLYSQ